MHLVPELTTVSASDKCYAQSLKKLRKQHLLKQAAIFDLLGLESQQQYSDLENGKRHFNIDMIVLICRLFKITVSEFVHCEGSSLTSYEHDAVDPNESAETKLLIYKKLLLEAQIENTELKLKILHQFRQQGF